MLRKRHKEIDYVTGEKGALGIKKERGKEKKNWIDAIYIRRMFLRRA